MERWTRMLYYTGVLLGAVVIASGIIRFATDGALTPLLIALAVIIAGPVENILMDWAEQKGSTPEHVKELCYFVDLATSIGFLICLGLAIYLA